MHKICRIIGGLFFLSGLLMGCVQEQTTPIHLFYTADTEGFFYSRPEPRWNNRETGGYAVLKSFLEKQTEPFLLLDGGNWFGSSPESAMTQGAYITPLLQAVPFSAAAVTENDFVFGWPALRSVIRTQKFPFIVSNVTLDNKIPWPMHNYQIFTQHGVKIGLLGIVNPQVLEKHKARLTGFVAKDPIETSREIVSLLRGKGVDYIVVLSSLGESDQRWTDTALAAEVTGIDLILSANKGIERAEVEEVNHTPIVYPGSRLDSIAHITLTFTSSKQLKKIDFEDIVLFQDTYGADEKLSEHIRQIRETTRQKMTARLTQVEQDVTHDLADESQLGDLLADCLHRWAKLDGVVLNADSLRNSFTKGVIREYDLYNAYPYGDNITFITIRGKDFIRALEASLDTKDNFPQIAGFSVSYNPQGPLGKKIRQVILANGRILRPEEKYRFAVTDHILAGGFGHDLFINSLEFKNTFVEARQIMRSCLLRQKIVAVPAKGRWKKIK